MVEHVNIPDGEIHEPKGISTAAANTVYVANGTGSGTWTARNDDDNKIVMAGVIEDLSSSGQLYLILPVGARPSRIDVLVPGNLTGGDNVISVRSSGGTLLGSTTIGQSGVGAVSTHTANLSGSALTAGSYILVQTNGGNSNTISAHFSVLLEV